MGGGGCGGTGGATQNRASRRYLPRESPGTLPDPSGTPAENQRCAHTSSRSFRSPSDFKRHAKNRRRGNRAFQKDLCADEKSAIAVNCAGSKQWFVDKT